MQNQKKSQRIKKLLLKKLDYQQSLERNGTPAHFVLPQTPNALRFQIKNADGYVIHAWTKPTIKMLKKNLISSKPVGCTDHD